MPMGFVQAANFIMDLEGPYHLDPNDPGGETAWGISKRANPNVDIQALTRDDAAVIYKSQYWDACRIDLLPTPLMLLVFDCAVNQGTDKAIRLLQQATRSKEDGIMGPETINNIRMQGVMSVVPEFAALRMQAYGLIPQFSCYGKGWSIRLMRVVIESARANPY